MTPGDGCGVDFTSFRVDSGWVGGWEVAVWRWEWEVRGRRERGGRGCGELIEHFGASSNCGLQHSQAAQHAASVLLVTFFSIAREGAVYEDSSVVWSRFELFT